MMEKILYPLDMGNLPNIAGKISSERHKKKKGLLSRRQQQEDFISNKEGKSLVGVTSLASTFNAIIQNANLYARTIVENQEETTFVKIKIGDKVLSLNKLSGVGKTLDGTKTKNHIISFLQSAAVDNAQEQVLNFLNLNLNTINAAIALVMMEDSKGSIVDEETLGAFHVSGHFNRALKRIIEYIRQFGGGLFFK